jgi:alcohol dehydrogenase
MGMEGATGGAGFMAALDKLVEDVGCAGLKMSDYGITREELPAAVRKYHEVWGGNNDADPLKLSDEDVLGIFERSYR